MELKMDLPVRNEEKTEQENKATKKDSIIDSKDSNNVTKIKTVTWAEVIENKVEFQKDERPTILLKQSSSKKI